MTSLKGKPTASTLDEAEEICRGYFSQGYSTDLSIFKVMDEKQYEPGYYIVSGDESASGRRLCGQCRVKFVKVVSVPDCFDVRGWAVDNFPGYAEATRYLSPNTQYESDLAQWRKVGSPAIKS